LPLQQPLQVLASHTHTPSEQRWPATHAIAPPQPQLPSIRQPSPRPPAVQSTHAAPIEPHAPVACGVHRPVVALQQPIGHELPSHTHAPPMQCCPLVHCAPVVPHWQVPEAEQLSASVALHITHCTPLVPQLPSERGMQVLPLQQLLGHEVESHLQVAAEHSWPEAQAAAPPQVHTPADEQPSAVASHGAHCWPGGAQLPTASAVH
jgi:hypothetical protein